MKKLIFTLSLSLTYVHAAEFKELTDSELKNKFVSVIKDAEVQDMLENTAEFNDCRTKNQFRPNDPQRDAKIKAAQDCFRQKLNTTNDPEKLKKLSESMNLQGYGLVQSKNVQDITNYLSDKMYKSMTGVDPQEKNRQAFLESIKFKNRQQIDQKDFIDMYMSQLGKSALFEISRYCFEDLRSINGSKDAHDWQTHWGNTDFGLPASSKLVTDTGKPSFFDADTNITDKSTLYKNIYAGISKDKDSLDMKKLEKFFQFCAGSIRTLCLSFQNDDNKGVSNTSAVDLTGSLTSGAKSCLVMGRLQEMRKAMANTQKVSEDLDKMTPAQMTLALTQPVKFYDRASADASMDDLTTVTSKDVLDGGLTNNGQTQKQKNCIDHPENPECEGYLVVDDSKDRALYNIDVEMSLKREVEIARIKAEKTKGEQSFKQYLQDNGYFDILRDYNDKPLTDEELQDRVAQIFNARKEAEILAIKDKLGKRQLSESEANNADVKKEAVTANIEDTKQERARLAQVVLFNNIITSNIPLYKDDKGKLTEVGRNVNAWVKESKDLNSSSNVDMSLFQNVQTSIGSAPKPSTNGGTIVGLDLLDNILGKTK